MTDPIMQEAISATILILLSTLIPIAIGGVKVLLVDVFPYCVRMLRAKLGEKQFERLQVVADVAVKFAEAVAKNEQVQNAGAYKRAQAEAYLNEFLKKSGMKFTATEIEGIIEAAVLDNFPKTVEAAPYSNRSPRYYPPAGEPKE